MDGPAGHLRVGDRERADAIETLRRAHSEGRIDLSEFDERSASTWAARTYYELSAVTADLPTSSWVTGGVESAGSGVARDWRSSAPLRVMRGSAEFAWLVAVSINLVIWLLVSAGSSDSIYPWWIWVAGPWGAVLLAARISGIGRPHR
ncbi:DUF1707 SHOCT-like domain-containing protein [Parasphingorhabdus pacifica]